MGKSKKWEIEGIKKKQIVLKAAKIILKSRLDHLIETINNYFEEQSVENLHQVRIALRRVRYNMELFISCFDRKLFLKLYNEVESLQDNSGFVRDLDVFKENITSLTTEGNVSNSTAVNSLSRVIHTTPESPKENDSVTVFLDTTQPGAKKLFDYDGAVYAHTGVNTNQGNWRHVVGKWGDNQMQPRLKKLSTNLYEFVIDNPRQFYNINDPFEQIQQLIFVFRNEDSSLQTPNDNTILVGDLDDSQSEAASLKAKGNLKVISSVLSKIETRRNELETKLELELMKFQHSKLLKKFYKQLK
jgi:hypothetical protein